MTDQDLDIAYTALCGAIDRAGEDKAPLFLGMLALSLIARLPKADDALTLIRQVLDSSVD